MKTLRTFILVLCVGFGAALVWADPNPDPSPTPTPSDHGLSAILNQNLQEIKVGTNALYTGQATDDVLLAADFSVPYQLGGVEICPATFNPSHVAVTYSIIVALEETVQPSNPGCFHVDLNAAAIGKKNVIFYLAVQGDRRAMGAINLLP